MFSWMWLCLYCTSVDYTCRRWWQQPDKLCGEPPHPACNHHCPRGPQHPLLWQHDRSVTQQTTCCLRYQDISQLYITNKIFVSLTGKLIHSMVAHLNAVSSLAVDPNGLYLLSGSKSWILASHSRKPKQIVIRGRFKNCQFKETK